MRRLFVMIATLAVAVGVSFASSGCHLQPADVCNYYQPGGDLIIYHWHTHQFSWGGQNYEGGYHCVKRINGFDNEYCIGEQSDGDTDFISSCLPLHV